jgi:16S rRNA A1518/A1519 N6-dimethyltransferase RsmA/KsgA/DIM1 with predicted DNA glycosylase/AP lyase activity
VAIKPRSSPFPIDNPERFDAVVNALFEHRRKTVENGLRLAWRSFADSPESLEEALAHVPFRGQRVEELPPEDIAHIAEALPGAKG